MARTRCPLPGPAGLPWWPISEICLPGEGAFALFLGRTPLTARHSPGRFYRRSPAGTCR